MPSVARSHDQPNPQGKSDQLLAGGHPGGVEDVGG